MFLIVLLLLAALAGVAALLFFLPAQTLGIVGAGLAVWGLRMVWQANEFVADASAFQGYVLAGSGLTMVAAGGALRLIVDHLAKAPARTAEEIVRALRKSASDASRREA